MTNTKFTSRELELLEQATRNLFYHFLGEANHLDQSNQKPQADQYRWVLDNEITPLLLKLKEAS